MVQRRAYNNNADDYGGGGGHDHHDSTRNDHRPQHHSNTTDGMVTKRTSLGSSARPSDVAHHAAMTVASSSGVTSTSTHLFQSPIPPAGSNGGGGGISRSWMSSPSPPMALVAQHQALPTLHHHQQSSHGNDNENPSATATTTSNWKTPRRQLDFQNTTTITNGNAHHHHHHHSSSFSSLSIDDSEQQTSGEPTSSSFSSLFLPSKNTKSKTKTAATTLRRSGSSSLKDNSANNSTSTGPASKGRGIFGSYCGGGGYYSFGSLLMIMIACSCCSYILMAVKLAGNSTTIMDIQQQIEMEAANFGGDEPVLSSLPPKFPKQKLDEKTKSKSETATKSSSSSLSSTTKKKEQKKSNTADVEKKSKSSSTIISSAKKKIKAPETKTASKLRSSSSKNTEESKLPRNATPSTKPTSPSSSSSSQLRATSKTTKAKKDNFEMKKTTKNSKTKISGRSSTSTPTMTAGSGGSSGSGSSISIIGNNIQNKTLVTTVKSLTSSSAKPSTTTTNVTTVSNSKMNLTTSKPSLLPSNRTTSSNSIYSIQKDALSSSVQTPYKFGPRVVGLVITYHTNNDVDNEAGDKASGGGPSVVAAVDSVLNSTVEVSTRKGNGPYSVQYMKDLSDAIFLQSRRKRISDVQRSIVWQKQHQLDAAAAAAAAASIDTNATTALSSPTAQSMDVDLFELPPLLEDEDNEIRTPPVPETSSESQTNATVQFTESVLSNATRTIDSVYEKGASIGDDLSTTNDEDTCQPMADWMTSSFVNCNTIHEIDMLSGAMRQAGTDVQFLGQGWFRSAWRYSSTSTNAAVEGDTTPSPPLILKTLRIEREFLDEYFDLHRRDAVAMERLTSSPFVMDVYGYCGQSALNEFAEGIIDGQINSLEQLNRRMRGREKDEKTLKLKLQLATSVALGLAHVHNVNVGKNARIPTVKELLYDIPNNGNETTTGFYESMATMAHYDINPRNIAIMKDGKPKLNDFNIAEFLQYKVSKNDDGTKDIESCGFRSRLHEPWWRAPEEMNTNLTEVVTVREKVDVYALGNVLYHILTTHSPRGKMKKERMDEVRNLVQAGVAPTLTEPFASDPGLKKHRIVKAFVKAMDLCFAKNPETRGSSVDVARVLHQALQREKERDVQTHLEQRDGKPDARKNQKTSLKKVKATKTKPPSSKTKKNKNAKY